MRIWLINNTKFGYKNNCKKTSQMMFDYFYKHFIPLIDKNKKDGDILIHSGNIFNSVDNLNITLLLKVIKLFDDISEKIPFYIINGNNEINQITKLFKQTIIDSNTKLNNIKIIRNDVLNNIDSNDKIILINSNINTELLKDFNDKLFLIGYHDNNSEKDNIITIGSPYQLDKCEDDRGFYIIDTNNNKYKLIKNNYSPKYKTLKITDISQISELNQDDIKYNNVDIIIDKKLVDEKKIKIDVLLNKFDFKSITYINDDTEIINIHNNSINIEEIIKTKIFELNDPAVNIEFENIMKIYNEKYKI
jgi:hypothetical protein